MTQTVTRPAVEVEPIPMARVYALILAETRRAADVPPIGISQNGPGSTILRVAFNSFGHLATWCEFFGAPQPKPAKHPDLPIMHDIVHCKWQGWSVQLSATEPADEAPEMDAVTAALIDEVIAEPIDRCLFCDHEGPLSPGGLLGEHLKGTKTCIGSGQRPVRDAALKVDPVTAIAEGRPIDLVSVGGHFADTWSDLNDKQRDRLVYLCGVTGWTGDWNACYQQMATDQALRSAPVDDARLVVAELDDIPVVSVAQLTAVADVDPDDAIAYEIAHRHEGPQIVDVRVVDPELADDGRGGAGVERMTGVVVNVTRGTVEGITDGSS